MNAREGAHIHPVPLFHFRMTSHVSKSMKTLSLLKVPQDLAHRDRQGHSTTILLCKAQSSQAAMGPQEHKVFMEEAYSAGDHQPWDSGRQGRGWGGQVPADSIISLHQKCPWDESQRESSALGPWGCQGPCGHSETYSREPYTPSLASSCLLKHYPKPKACLPHTSPSFLPHHFIL